MDSRLCLPPEASLKELVPSDYFYLPELSSLRSDSFCPAGRALLSSDDESNQRRLQGETEFPLEDPHPKCATDGLKTLRVFKPSGVIWLGADWEAQFARV
jgi:hypothetical protein